MIVTKVNRIGTSWLSVVVCCLLSFALANAQDSPEPAQAPESQKPAEEATDLQPKIVEGPGIALEFEKSFRDLNNRRKSKPVRFENCENITMLTKDLWSKKHVLSDFKATRTEEQIGVIVFVKTEYCCKGSRLCAVTTACMEKKSTPLVGRFKVYGGWIKNNPDHPIEEWNEWDQQVIKEYGFQQGPGARIVVYVPTWDGKMFQWQSNATKLGFSRSTFERNEGKTPKLERLLQNALKYVPETVPDPPQLSQN